MDDRVSRKGEVTDATATPGLFQDLERTLYRSFEVTVTTNRVLLNRGEEEPEEYSVESLEGVDSHLWTVVVRDPNENPWHRRLGLVLILLGVFAPGTAFIPLTLLENRIDPRLFTPVFALVYFLQFGLPIIPIVYGVKLRSGRKRTLWCARITLRLRTNAIRVINLVSPVPVDDVVPALETAIRA